jgi:uncharacterized membrane protein
MWWAMTAARLIPFPVHGALELVTGLFLLAAPFVFAFTVPAGVISISIAVLLVGLALGAATADGRSRSLPVATHHAFDHGLALGLLGAAAVLAVAGDEVAGIVLAAAAAAQLALNLTTRYSLRG